MGSVEGVQVWITTLFYMYIYVHICLTLLIVVNLILEVVT